MSLTVNLKHSILSHNPYFNRWFSAINTVRKTPFLGSVTILILIDGFLQYKILHGLTYQETCHNPYFNRWFSAILTVL